MQKVFTETCLEDVDLSKTQQGKYFVYMDGEIQAKSELRKQQYTVTLFDCNHLAHVIVLSQMQTLLCYRTVFASFYFKFEGNFQV